MNDTVESLVTKLARELASWKSIDLRGRCDYDVTWLPSPEIVPVDHVTFRYVEQGRSIYFDDEMVARDGSANRQASYRDGDVCFDVRFDPKAADRPVVVAISRAFRNEARTGWVDRPLPIQYFHVGLVPLYEALPRAQHVGPARVGERDCEVFRFASFKDGLVTQDLVYHLDTATGLPLKIDSYTDEAAYRAEAPSWTWLAGSLESVQGYHFPMTSTMTRYQPHKGEGSPAVAQTVHVKVESVRYDEPHPRTFFRPELRPGVEVHDYIKGKTYVVPGAAPTADVAGTVAAPVAPIRAVVPSGWAPIVSGVGLTLGLLASAVAVYLWRRR